MDKFCFQKRCGRIRLIVNCLVSVNCMDFIFFKLLNNTSLRCIIYIEYFEYAYIVLKC